MLSQCSHSSAAFFFPNVAASDVIPEMYGHTISLRPQ